MRAADLTRSPPRGGNTALLGTSLQSSTKGQFHKRSCRRRTDPPTTSRRRCRSFRSSPVSGAFLLRTRWSCPCRNRRNRGGKRSHTRSSARMWHPHSWGQRRRCRMRRKCSDVSVPPHIHRRAPRCNQRNPRGTPRNKLLLRNSLARCLLRGMHFRSGRSAQPRSAASIARRNTPHRPSTGRSFPRPRRSRRYLHPVHSDLESCRHPAAGTTTDQSRLSQYRVGTHRPRGWGSPPARRKG